MQITIFGASGKIGTQVVALALQRGHTVVAFVHSHNPFEDTPYVRVKKGDTYNAADVAEALRGSQAVISCLGSWGSKPGDVLSAAMKNIIPAMETQKITRIISLTGSGAFDTADTISTGQKIFHRLFSIFAGKILVDGEAHMRLLRATKLDWTVIRSPVMRNSSDASYGLRSELSKLGESVSRKAVTAALVDQLDRTDMLQQAPVIFMTHVKGK